MNRVFERRLDLLVAALVIIAVLFSLVPDGFAWSQEDSSDDAGAAGSLARRLQWLPLILVAFTVVWLHRSAVLRLLPQVNPFLLAFVVWACATMLWSPLPEVTLRKLVLLAGALGFAFALQLRPLAPDALLRLLRVAVSIGMVISLPMALFLPEIGRDPNLGYAWVGLTQSKNHLGMLSGFGLLLWLHAAGAHQTTWMRAAPWLLLSIILMIGCRSATSLLCTLIAVVCMWPLLRPFLATRNFFLVGGLVGAAIVVVVAHVYITINGIPTIRDLIEPVAAALGRDVTLTGRSNIWRMVMLEVRGHWWLGHGYGAFWLGDEGPAAWIAKELYWVPWQAHNGYIDILNETGLVGLGLTIGFLLWHGQQVLRLAVRDRVTASFHVAFYIFFVVNNFSESSAFRPMQFLFLLSIFTSLALSRTLAMARVGYARRGAQARAGGDWMRH